VASVRSPVNGSRNIVLALAIIVALFPLAQFGVLGLAQVVPVHEAAEIVVILNGIRAARRPMRRTVARPTSPVEEHTEPCARNTTLTR
jgi:cation-transporting P-type ATPase G